MFLAAAYLLFLPLLRGTENLNAARSAQCLEESVIVLGIFLMAGLNGPEQSKPVREAAGSRKIPYWKILLLRLIMAAVLLAVMVSVFCAVMTGRNCTFPFISYAAGTFISAMTLGCLGFLASVISDSVIIGYLASTAYFLLNLLGSLSNENIFCLFFIETGDFITKIWFLGWSIVMVTAALTAPSIKTPEAGGFPAGRKTAPDRFLQRLRRRRRT